MTKNNTGDQFGSLVGSSRAMRQVFSLIEKAAEVNLPVLIVGESGTGKELVAREIHARSNRTGAFVAVNTGALSPQLVASELFGHIKGAYTGATDRKEGRFIEAHLGALFLDEVSTMEERVQVSLLRVLETGAFRPLGAKRDRSADVRLIAATNVDLNEAAEMGQFREDLLYRLQVFRIYLPPLRKHKEDLAALIPHFLENVRGDFALDVEGVSQPALAAMRNYHWPGNVRELKNVVAQAAVMAESGTILPKHLPDRITSSSGSSEDAAAPLERLAAAASAKAADVGSAPAADKQTAGSEIGFFIPMGATLEEVQKAYTLRMLAHCENNKTYAAKVLGISRKTLYDRLMRWQ